MSPLTLDRLRRDGQAFLEEISREYHRAGAGYQREANLQPIYARHAATLGSDALALVLETFRAATAGSEEQRGARMLLDWQVESQSARALASLDEREIAWEATAIVRLADGREVPFQRAAIELANQTDRGERLALEKARATLVAAELAPLRRERFQREREITESLGIADGYVPTWELLTGIQLEPLRAQCEAFLADTQAMWDAVLPGFLKRGLGITTADATRADALALFRAREFDVGFPGAGMEDRIGGNVAEMGLDLRAAGRITVDTAEREGKRSRAFCAPVRIPEEVYLVLRPHGGQADWTTFLHELGHALHFAHMRPDLPMEYRWLGDNSVTEGYAMLFDHLTGDPGWLHRYTELGAARVDAYLRAGAFEELHFLRRYCAKLAYEVAIQSGDVPWDDAPALYVDRLTTATHFRYDPADAFVDVDPRFYAARYLRAWQLQALLTESLVERYDEDWWRNPRTGPFLRDSLFGEGQRELAHEQAARVTGRELTFAPLVRAIEKRLA